VNRREFLVAAATLPVTLRFAPPALAGGTPLALVTADTQSRVAAVELSSGRIVRSIPTLPDPRSVESSLGRIAVVAHTKSGAVSLLDGPTLTVRHVLRDFREPRYTAAHPNGRHAFVTDSGSGEVVSVDLLRGRSLGRAALGGPARHISLDPTGRTLWVSLGFNADRIAIVSVERPEQPRLRHLLRPPFHAHDVGFTPGGRHVWVSSGDRGTLAVYDARSGKALRRLPGDAPPQHVTFLGDFAYVASGDDATLRVHSLRDGRIVHTTRVPEGSYNVQQAWGVILTPSLHCGMLTVVNPAGRVLRHVRAAPSSHDACFVMSA
jgi:DNA-binding beta-propeller fold protein YncE